MNNKIRHAGIVENVEDGHVQVRIVQTSACAACKVAGHCNASESKEKLVDVYRVDAARWHVGDAVTVAASQQVAAKALLLGFGLPLLLMLVVLLLTIRLTGSEAQAAAFGLLALIPYYALLYLFRDSMRERLAFTIE